MLCSLGRIQKVKEKDKIIVMINVNHLYEWAIDWNFIFTRTVDLFLLIAINRSSESKITLTVLTEERSRSNKKNTEITPKCRHKHVASNNYSVGYVYCGYNTVKEKVFSRNSNVTSWNYIQKEG